MRKEQKRNLKDFTLRSLAKKLRELPEVEIPITLKSRLLAVVPGIEPKVVRQAAQYPRVWSFGAAAAAAVMIVLLMILVNYGLPTPSQMMFTELNDTSLCCSNWDQNSLFYDQNNFLYDQNSSCIKKTSLFDSNRLTINPNELVN